MKLKVFGAVAKAAARWVVSPVAWKYERPLLVAFAGAVVEAVRAAVGHP